MKRAAASSPGCCRLLCAAIMVHLRCEINVEGGAVPCIDQPVKLYLFVVFSKHGLSFLLFLLQSQEVPRLGQYLVEVGFIAL